MIEGISGALCSVGVPGEMMGMKLDPLHPNVLLLVRKGLRGMKK